MTIERAARAIAEADQGRKPNKFRYEDMARAALRAIAEPTPEMIVAGNTAAFAPRAISIAEAVWHAMHTTMMNSTD